MTDTERPVAAGIAKKLWRTDGEHQHSKAGAYRRVARERGRWLDGQRADPTVVVTLDERDGRGPQVYEIVDFAATRTEAS